MITEILFSLFDIFHAIPFAGKFELDKIFENIILTPEDHACMNL